MPENEGEQDRDRDHEQDGGDEPRGGDGDGGGPREEPAPRPTPRKPPARPAPRAVPATERPIPEDPDEVRAELLRARQALASRNKENQAFRARLDELEEAERQRREASMSDQDRARQASARKDAEIATLRAEKDELLARLHRTLIDHEVSREGARLFEDPGLAVDLVDRAALEVDEETGRVRGVKEALERVLKRYPKLAKEPPAKGGVMPERASRQPGGGARKDRDRGEEPVPVSHEISRHIGGYD